MPYVVGLTGGIGCGKSEVANVFAALGVDVVDTDALAHALVAPGEPALDEIRNAFGADLVEASGRLDRAGLRRRVFADDHARSRLEQILHPRIGAAAQREVNRWAGPYGILMVPLLLEKSGLRAIVDRVLVVDCSEEDQVRRVVQRSGLAPADVRAIMATQVDRRTRLVQADDVIDNEGPRSALEPQVRALDAHYRRLAAGGASVTPAAD
jgi:dephospho-CoA kinase